MHVTRKSAFIALCAFLLPLPALAGEISSADTAWLLTATALVLFMTLPGLSLFYGGLVRVRNVLSVLMQCFALAALMSVVWFVAGYTLAFGSAGVEQGAWIGDLGNLMLMGIDIDGVNGSIPDSLFVMFQMTFAIITPALIIGGFAERIRFSALLLFSTAWLLLVYAPICHWVWGGGWLGAMGLQDFAGGTVVHITAGVAALVAAIMMGPRRGFGSVAMPPHNLTMTVTGAGMLWVGWFGFNAGSAVAANGSAGMAMLVTQIAAASAGIAWMLAEWFSGEKKPSLLGLCSGAVAGLVAITPAAGFVNPMGAFFIGLISGVLCFLACTKLKSALGYDDALDVFGIHAFGGAVGAVLTGVFATKAIGGVEGGFDQVKLQLLGVGVTVLYTAVATYIILKVVNLITPLRASDAQERDGLDLSQHGEQVS